MDVFVGMGLLRDGHVALGIGGEVADTWYALVALRAQLEAQEAILETNRTQLTSLEKSYDLGRAEASDVVQQRQLVAGTEAKVTTLKQSVATSGHRLAVLTGQSADTALPSGNTLPTLPAMPETGVPVVVLMQRPDVASAYLALQAADHEYAAAVTNRLPQFSLTGTTSTSGSSTHDLFRNWIATLAGQLVTPIIDGGRLKASADAARSRADTAFWTFNQTLLEAGQDVEDALVIDAHQLTYLQQVQKQAALADQSVELLKIRYYQGTDTFTAYLSAIQSSQSLKLSLIQAEEALIRNRVSLYRALAGTVEMSEPERLPSRVDHFLISQNRAPAAAATATNLQKENE